MAILLLFLAAIALGAVIGLLAERAHVIDRTVPAAILIGATGAVAGFMVLTVANAPLTWRLALAIVTSLAALWLLPGRGK